ncbi:acyl dehydratase [Nostocoides sp. F2B08]|uniref:MaoC/PaaZ C-terminal domain-containing protein n=1 Tax=Nostocoides sp. F2B08 TaxID=2653936 RepID=UPI001262AF2A|nr:MaoC/PaaZ C-terminal domain-containing protein [Tetrasphaera sp. F2B08]KAB7746366.1 acyl dehydratase [Tetrasphaera sp. F2B08]
MALSRTDVGVGDTIGPLAVPVTREALVAYADASLDRNPIHQDEEFAKGVGLPDVIAHGMWTMGAASSVVAAWAGDAGRVEQFRTRFTAMVVVPRDGAEVEVRGVVKSIDDDGRATVDVSVSAEGTKVLGRCTAVVRLDP